VKRHNRSRFEIELEVLKAAAGLNSYQIMLKAKVRDHVTTSRILHRFVVNGLLSERLNNGHLHYFRTQQGAEAVKSAEHTKVLLTTYRGLE